MTVAMLWRCLLSTVDEPFSNIKKRERQDFQKEKYQKIFRNNCLLFTFTNLYNKKVIHKYFIYNKKWLPTNLYRRTDGYCLLYKKQYIKKTLFYLQYVV